MANHGEDFQAIVVGGGFFGVSLALFLRKKFERVAVIEREADLLQRASLINQARVHGGYHYPRSLVTGLRSRENFRLFTDYFSDCVDSSFKKYYAISSYSSAVTANQFKLFCERIGAPLSPAPKNIISAFNPDLIEGVFEVEEFAFDAVKLKNRLRLELEDSGVSLFLNTDALQVTKGSHENELCVSILPQGGARSDSRTLTGREVYTCLYSGTNHLLYKSNLPQIPLRQEYTEMCLVKPPDFLAGAGVTVMCGPFFSIMPFPSRGLHSFSHVRYTPHFSWSENDEIGAPKGYYDLKEPPQSKYAHMLKDAARYLPLAEELSYVESIWESKTLLPRNEMDDARPILFKRDHGLKNLNCIIGAKIDNIFDVNQALMAT